MTTRNNMNELSYILLFLLVIIFLLALHMGGWFTITLGTTTAIIIVLYIPYLMSKENP